MSTTLALLDWIRQIPNPQPSPPPYPGERQILWVLGIVKWGAGVALVLGFFVGLIVWAGGRWVDHHRAGKIGVVMMLCAMAGAILYGIGWSMISAFAAAG